MSLFLKILIALAGLILLSKGINLFSGLFKSKAEKKKSGRYNRDNKTIELGKDDYHVE